jgi:coenzyme F420-reducing hydrogenase alpha subunit
MAMRGRHLLGGRISALRNGQLEHLPHDYEGYIKEYLQHDSTGEFVVLEGKAYAVGPQARMNVNWDLQEKELRGQLPIKAPAHSPFCNIVFQSLEIVTGLKRAAKIVSQLIEAPVRAEKPKRVKPRASTGVGVVEAPRGLLFHKYSFDDDGYCTYANVTTPTSQNLRNMEACLRTFVRAHLHLPEEELILETEKLIRAFDPCMSCSSH